MKNIFKAVFTVKVLYSGKYGSKVTIYCTSEFCRAHETTGGYICLYDGLNNCLVVSPKLY